MKESAPKESKFSSFREDPFSEGRQNFFLQLSQLNLTVVSPERVSILLKISSDV